MPTGSLSRTECPCGPQLGGNIDRGRPAQRAARPGSKPGETEYGDLPAHWLATALGAGAGRAGITQRKPQASQTQDRVGLSLAGRLVGGKLVRAQVERPDHDRPAAHRADDRGIDLELLVFARGGLGVQEQEFRPEQPDADGTPIEASLDFTAKLDIAPELDARAVLGLGGQAGLLA